MGETFIVRFVSTARWWFSLEKARKNYKVASSKRIRINLKLGNFHPADVTQVYHGWCMDTHRKKTLGASTTVERTAMGKKVIFMGLK